MLSQKHMFCMDMTVLERQQARFKWLLQQQQENNHVSQYDPLESCSVPTDLFHGFFDHESMNGDRIDWKKQPEIYLGNNDLPNYGGFSLNGTEFVASNKMDFGESEVTARPLEFDHCLSRTSSCQTGVVEAAKIERVVSVNVAGEVVTLMENKESNHGRRDNSNKRKVEVCSLPSLQVHSIQFSNLVHDFTHSIKKIKHCNKKKEVEMELANITRKWEFSQEYFMIMTSIRNKFFSENSI